MDVPITPGSSIPADVTLAEPALPPGQQPLFIYLFTHTEDHINHELSEERYQRLAPEIARLANANPGAGLSWTIEFMGADAATVAERNPSTGVADLLREYAAQGVVEFGYHGQHEPTYDNRPQNLLQPDSSWEARVQALESYIRCQKDPLRGGCIAETGGGLLAVREHFGQVQIVTGLPLASGSFIAGGAARHAIVRHQPDYLLSFGFSDHAPTPDRRAYREAVNALMAILTPSLATSPGAFWMDDAIRINDSGVIPTLGVLSLIEGPGPTRRTMEAVDRSRPQVMNAGFASKYIYTAQGTSPTIWAYANPLIPELDASHRNPEPVRDQLYQDNLGALEYLVTEFLPANPGSRFINSRELIQLVAPEKYWEVTAEELDAIARWILQGWRGRPPDFASDGLEFYSLRDAMGLLASALAERQRSGDWPAEQQLTLFYGPLEQTPAGNELAVTADDVYGIAGAVDQALRAAGPWKTTPGNILPTRYTTSGGEVNVAQALYALATHYAASYTGESLPGFLVPSSEMVPATYGLLLDLGCWDCVDTAWSLKPAQLHLDL